MAIYRVKPGQEVIISRKKGRAQEVFKAGQEFEADCVIGLENKLIKVSDGPVAKETLTEPGPEETLTAGPADKGKPSKGK